MQFFSTVTETAWACLLFSVKNSLKVFSLNIWQTFSSSSSCPTCLRQHFSLIFLSWLCTEPLGLFSLEFPLKLLWLLDENPRGAVGLLQSRSQLAVPHAHRGLWKIVLPLQNTEKRKEKKKGVRYRQAAPGASGGGGGLELIWVARWLLDWICRKRTGFSIQEYLCLPCQTLPAGELQQVASCWRGRATCVRPQDQNIRVSQVLKGQITLEGNGRFNKERKKKREKVTSGLTQILLNVHKNQNYAQQ